MIDVPQAVQLLLENDHILILAHDHPDGDTLGSGFALMRALRALGKNAAVKCSDTIPATYAFMWEGLSEQDFEPGFIVAVDIADTRLLGSEFEKLYADRIDLCIDHHGSNTRYAKNILLDNQAAAASEIIYDLIAETGVALDAVTADCLYTGISTDTGCFRYSNTTARSHFLAAKLIEAGASTNEINRVFFETKTKTYAALERLALENLEMFFGERCAVITITQEMYRISGSNDSEVDRISALPRQIEGVLVGAAMREMKDGSFKVSVRTLAGVNAAELCGKMGGGGHSMAAGCHLPGPRDRALKEFLGHVADALK